jgi:hypothetical protein
MKLFLTLIGVVEASRQGRQLKQDNDPISGVGKALIIAFSVLIVLLCCLVLGNKEAITNWMYELKLEWQLQKD